MRQENSVLFALRDLRHLEAERCADEQRIEEQQRLAEEARRRAEAAAREAEEQRRRDDEARRLREEDERQSLASALRETSARNAVLESDVRELRALVAASPTAPARASRWPYWLAAAAAVAIAMVMVMATRPRPIRERVVYVAPPPPVARPAAIVTPTAIVTPAPAVPSPAVPKIDPRRALVRARPKRQPSAPKPATKAPAIDDCGGKDPLCGLKL